MRGVQVTRFGGPEVLVAAELPEPVAGAGELVVDVVAAEVLFLDTQLRAGWGQEYFAITPPFVPGAGVSGTVRSVGEEVDPGLVGRRVIADTGGIGKYLGGGYAEQVLVPASEVFPVPDGLELTVALAALHDGTTALSLLDQAEVRAGEQVLVNGAAGSLGNWLVPILAESGATVIAGARGEEKLAYARKLGADIAVDYSEPGWTNRVLEATGHVGVDVVFDGVGGEIGRAAFDITLRGGRFQAYGAASGDFAGLDPERVEERGVTLVGIYQPEPQDWRQIRERALAELAAGRVRPLIGQAFPLERAADAHAAIGSRTTLGKTLLLA